MQIHIALLLTDERLVALRLEEFPGADEVLHHTDVRTRLDIEVAGIKETADIQTGNEFVGLVLRVGLCSLTVQVEVVAFRCLQIALLERFTVPSAVALVHVHVVHVDRHPHIGGGIGDLVIDMLVDEEVVCLGIAVLDKVDTPLLHGCEVEFHIIIFKVRSPRLDAALKGLRRRTVCVDTHQRGCSLWRIMLVEFDDGHFRLFWGIAYLRETNVRFTDPVGDGVGLHGPGHHFARLSLRQYAAQYKPTVLCQHPSVVEFQLCVITANADHA